MEAKEINDKLVEAYLKLLNSLNIENKLELISRLTHAMQKERADKSDLEAQYGAWKDETTAEQLISELRDDRVFNQNRASL